MIDQLICPYCLCPIMEDDAVVCDSCGAAHHGECWGENGGCCVRDCERVSRQIEVEVERADADKLVLTRESVESARPRRPGKAFDPCIRCGRPASEGRLHCERCTPEPEESQDARNLGPLLVMLGIAALLLLLLFMTQIGPAQDSPRETDRVGIETKVEH